MVRFLLLLCIIYGCLITNSVSQKPPGDGGNGPPPPPKSGPGSSNQGGGGGPPPSPQSTQGAQGGGGGAPPPAPPAPEGPPPSPSPPDGNGGPPPPGSPHTSSAPTIDPTIVNCATAPKILETYLSIDGIGDPNAITQTDLNAMGKAFQETYDKSGQFNCDVLFRRATEVKIQIYDFPTMASDFVNINFIFKVRYSCRGADCSGSNPAVLFSLLDGFFGRRDRDSKSKDDPQGGQGGGQQRRSIGGDTGDSNFWELRGRNLESDRELQAVCGECNTDNPTRASASPRQFVDAYRDAIEELELTSVKSITNLLEIQPEDCSGIEEHFTDEILFGLEGDPNNVTDADLRLLGETFLSSYNYYSDVQCDLRFLQVDSIDIVNEPIFPDEARRLQFDLGLDLTYTNGGDTISFFFIFGYISGACKGCADDTSLYNDASRLRFRRELERQGVRGRVMTKDEILEQQRRRTAEQLIGNANINMASYRQAMESGCQTCPSPAPTVSVAPSAAPSSNPTRLLPGRTFFDSDRCFCARQGPDFPGQTVGLDDAFNTTFVQERDDGRYKGFNRYNSVQFGNMRGSGGGGGGGQRKGRLRR